MSAVYIDPAVLLERMMDRVTKTDHGCWIFDGCVNSRGYGCVGSGKKSKSILTHRLVVLVRDGQLPDELTVDHLCEVKRCVNPDHLEVVTRRENSMRYHRNRMPAPLQMDGPSFDIVALLEDMGGAA